ncbi:hypothetical protein Dda_3791 [Drechslerella dactyloides]|uniref:Uncharacterized protein n=1 Tax=Drechslerella dactyloides TaxID=74499 RepID=A0AAD6IZ15_DREDA|nr:hypothetical protein Dda_3791 [Drechslerella dactyloides]
MCLISPTERRFEYPVARRVSYVPPVTAPRHETVIVERPRSSYDSRHRHHSTHRHRSDSAHHRNGSVHSHSKSSVVYATPRASYVSSRRESVPVVVERTYR